ncbi:hypothetical protein EON65_55840 [archaeon]|nr:MAG: hypothetical protein EON65_55840 [archaeon]
MLRKEKNGTVELKLAKKIRSYRAGFERRAVANRSNNSRKPTAMKMKRKKQSKTTPDKDPNNKRYYTG